MGEGDRHSCVHLLVSAVQVQRKTQVTIHTFYRARPLKQTTTYTFKKDRSRDPTDQTSHFQDGEQRQGQKSCPDHREPKSPKSRQCLVHSQALQHLSQLADIYCESKEVLAS